MWQFRFNLLGGCTVPCYATAVLVTKLPEGGLSETPAELDLSEEPFSIIITLSSIDLLVVGEASRPASLLWALLNYHLPPPPFSSLHPSLFSQDAFIAIPEEFYNPSSLLLEQPQMFVDNCDVTTGALGCAISHTHN